GENRCAVELLLAMRGEPQQRLPHEGSDSALAALAKKQPQGPGRRDRSVRRAGAHAYLPKWAGGLARECGRPGGAWAPAQRGRPPGRVRRSLREADPGRPFPEPPAYVTGTAYPDPPLPLIP